ncbi:MAG: hypothetical protein PUD93_12260 [Lachnospiraceae bacterium]|nr:hypothetical protein [Lachnospiraceae bacterium]
MKKKMITRIASLLSVAILLTVSVPMPVAYAEEAMEETEMVLIETADDFLEFAQNCTIDSWSVNKVVELQTDISLAGEKFEPIPVFAGTFNGNGHTISGVYLTGSGYADGFFRYVTQTGIIQDLTVKGAISSENEKTCTGGLCGVNAGWIIGCTFIGRVEGKKATGSIAGENERTGKISTCFSRGTVTGYNQAGGIAGINYGAIRNCTNKACINSDSSWLEEEDDAGLEGIWQNVKEGKLVSGTDIGGIAGYSDGIVINCNNQGVIGYEHNGYNIGGIVGRQAGQVVFCNNSGRVYGRKDVGGIVGQMEPYISVEESESISEAVQKLHDLVDKFLDDAGATQDTVSADFDTLRGYSDAALDDADTIAGETIDFVDENVAAVNEMADRIDYVMDELPSILDEAKLAIGDMNRAAGNLGKVADTLDFSGKVENSEYNETKHARLSLVSGVGGEIYSDKGSPAEGEVVTLTVTPEEGYAMKDIRVLDANQNTITLTDVSSGGTIAYSFVMPASNVVAKVEFYSTYDGSGGTGNGRILSITNSNHQTYDPPASEPAKYSITVKKNSVDCTADVLGDKEGHEGDVMVVNTNADSGCQTSVTATAADGTVVPCSCSPTDDSRWQFTMPAQAVTVDVQFTKTQIILESNAGGKADYTVSNNKVTLNVHPNSGYTVNGNPSASYNNGANQIAVTKKNAGSYVYEFSITPEMGAVKVYIEFKTSTDSEAVDHSKNNLSENVTLLQSQMKDISNTVDKISKMEENGATDEEIVAEVLVLAEQLADAGETLSYILSDLNTIANIMSPYIEEALKQAGVEIDVLIDDLESSFFHLDTAFGKVRSTMIYLNTKFDIQFVELGDEADVAIESLFKQLDAISAYSGQIGDDIDAHSDILEADLHAINDQVNVIFQLFSEKIEDVEDLYYDERGYEDISDDVIDASTEGKVERCNNTGRVKGDVNIGGIAGSMAIDEEDPEGNAAGSVNRSFGSRYLTKCIVTGCKNEGQITAKKNGAGGIVGYMNMGIVTDCEAYGSVESAEGEYVGGISGESQALIRNCWALTNLEGFQYVGGIAGAGKRIQDCYSMVSVNEDATRKGAIAGWVETEEGEGIGFGEDIGGNTYVNNGLGGIDNVSYAEATNPITYEKLLEITGVPIPYRHLKITFIADETVITQTEVKYGEKLDKIEMPDAPAGDGTFGKWPDISDQVMEGNLTLEAEYCDNITTLASEEVILTAETEEKESGQKEKPCAYIDGIYTDKAAFHAKESKWTAEETKENTGKKKVESTVYELIIDNADLQEDTVSKVRIYNPYEKIKAVYAFNGEEWEEISYKEYGEYLQVEMQGNAATYCIASGEKGHKWIFITAGGAVLLLVFYATYKYIKRK